MELGPVQTLAHQEGNAWVLNDPPPNKALELTKCQRYLRSYIGEDFAGLKALSTSNGERLIFNSTLNFSEMRIPPSIAELQVWDYNEHYNLTSSWQYKSKTQLNEIAGLNTILKPNATYLIEKLLLSAES